MYVEFFKKIYNKLVRFPGSAQYWEERYKNGGNSGGGSYGRLALYKAQIINDFVSYNNIQTVLELGCGDGNQLKLANYSSYTGYDISPTAIQICQNLFEKDASKKFLLYTHAENLPKAELVLSLDVIYHLVEDSVYKKYMVDLFNAAEKFVMIYSSNQSGEQVHHEKMRNFIEWVERHAPHFKLIEQIKNPFPYHPSDPENTSQFDFFIFKQQLS